MNTTFNFVIGICFIKKKYFRGFIKIVESVIENQYTYRNR